MWNGAISQENQNYHSSPNIKYIILKNLITSMETEFINFKTLEKRKSPGPYGSNAEFYQMLKEEVIAILLNLFQKIKRIHFIKSLLHWHQNQTKTVQKIKVQTHILYEFQWKNLNKESVNRIQQYFIRTLYHGIHPMDTSWLNIQKSIDETHVSNSLERKIKW